MRLDRPSFPLLAAFVLGACAAGPAVVQTTVAPPQDAALRLVEIVGAPGNRIDDLAEEIRAAGAARGVNIHRDPEAETDYYLVGSLAAFGDLTGVTVSYAFDAFDLAGARAHRVAGFETSPGVGGDPWTDLPGETLALIAARAVEALYAWLHTAPAQ